MFLAPGVRLGAYEIVALNGVGGMGEVYRARDTRLNRDVALRPSGDENELTRTRSWNEFAAAATADVRSCAA